MKRIAVIGATGTIGKAVADAFEARGDEVLRLSRKSETAIDLENPSSIRDAMAGLGPVDAIVCAAGRAAFGAALEASDADYQLCIDSKLMGQVNLVRFGTAALKPGGVIVLSSGILSRTPWPGSAPVAMVNAAVEVFAKAAALDIEGKRVEVVSPPLVQETAVAMGMPGEGAPPAAKVAETYLVVVDGDGSGQTHFVPGHAPS